MYAIDYLTDDFDQLRLSRRGLSKHKTDQIFYSINPVVFGIFEEQKFAKVNKNDGNSILDQRISLKIGTRRFFESLITKPRSDLENRRKNK